MARVGDHYVRVERPAPTPRYDSYDVMAAAFFGFLTGVLLLTLAVAR